MGRRIGEILIENGWAEASVVKRALAKHRQAGARLCSFLIANGVLDADHASRALGELHGVAAVLQKHLDRRDTSLASLLPATVARASVALPIGRMGNGDLIICVRDPSPALQQQLERTLRETIVLAVAPAQQLEELVAETYGRDEEMDVDIDIDVDTPPKMSLELDDEEDLSNLELVELDDHGVDKDASQSLQFTAPAQRASQVSMAGIALPRTLTPPPDDVFNPPTNRGGASGLDVLREPTQRNPRIDPLNPPSQRAPRTPPGRAALEVASQPAITLPPVEPEPAPAPPPRAPEPALPARTRTPLDAPTARTASNRDYFAARTSSRSDIIPVAALDELDPVNPATVRALAAGSVVPNDDALARAREVAAVLSLELDVPAPPRMESQHDGDLDLGLAPTVMSPLGPRVDDEPPPAPVVAARPSKSMPAAQPPAPVAGRSATRDTSPMALTPRAPASSAPIAPPPPEPEPAPAPPAPTPAPVSVRPPPTLAGSSLATPPAGVPIVRPAIPSIPKVPAKIPSIPSISKPAAAAKPALDVSPLEHATTLDDAIEMVMTLARSCWSAALLLDVDEAAAAGRCGFGPQLTDDDAMWIMVTFDEPSVISLATRATDVITGDTRDNEAQKLVAKAVGSPASAVAVRSRGSVVFVLVVGPPVGDGSVAALARLGAALGHAVARIAAR